MTAKRLDTDSCENIWRKQPENILLKLFPPFLTTTSIRAEFKPKKINGAFEGTYVKYKSEKDKKSSITGYPENFRTFLQSNKLS